jgi:toxin YoeB
MRNIAFTELAFREYNEWLEQPDILKKIRALIRDTCDNPFKGLGKPEPLKGNYAGCCRVASRMSMVLSIVSVTRKF